MEELLERVVHRVTLDMNDMLMREFSREEVKAALNCIGDLKAPGPDGMPAIFYKRFWDIVGDRVTEEVLGVLNGGDMSAEWNDTCVALIPKVLENRLKLILEEIIAPNQSAGSLPYSFDSLHYEAASCLEGIQWSRFWGMSKIRVETDSQTLVQAINSDAHDLFVSGHLFRQIKFHARSLEVCGWVGWVGGWVGGGGGRPEEVVVVDEEEEEVVVVEVEEVVVVVVVVVEEEEEEVVEEEEVEEEEEEEEVVAGGGGEVVVTGGGWRRWSPE
ncbi:hypothetical protein QYE76_066858 [Lolium multiflorum]|uniref:RNase H type-1 domain-containing protein n=1 Tax=Lolium multiflorum TaxID=4521 RepID=A0AAD8WAE3_LOLMU|nr:hypothetical protein QYE76_066858 [Lolium multiflorum]